MNTSSWLATIGNLPADCRPERRLIFKVNHHEHTHRVDVLADGTILWVVGEKQHAWISLDGIGFFTAIKPENALKLLNDWAPYGGNYRPPSWKRQGDLCVVTGLAKPTRGTAEMALLPRDCQPVSHLIFAVNQHSRTERIDVSSCPILLLFCCCLFHFIKRRKQTHLKKKNTHTHTIPQHETGFP